MIMTHETTICENNQLVSEDEVVIMSSVRNVSSLLKSADAMLYQVVCKSDKHLRKASLSYTHVLCDVKFVRNVSCGVKFEFLKRIFKLYTCGKKQITCDQFSLENATVFKKYTFVF